MSYGMSRLPNENIAFIYNRTKTVYPNSNKYDSWKVVQATCIFATFDKKYRKTKKAGKAIYTCGNKGGIHVCE